MGSGFEDGKYSMAPRELERPWTKPFSLLEWMNDGKEAKRTHSMPRESFRSSPVSEN